MYGEPPPSYQQSKYYPISKTSTTTTEAHIYENIDESNIITAKKHKGNFKLLKDKSSKNKVSKNKIFQNSGSLVEAESSQPYSANLSNDYN